MGNVLVPNSRRGLPGNVPSQKPGQRVPAFHTADMLRMVLQSCPPDARRRGTALRPASTSSPTGAPRVAPPGGSAKTVPVGAEPRRIAVSCCPSRDVHRQETAKRVGRFANSGKASIGCSRRWSLRGCQIQNLNSDLHQSASVFWRIPSSPNYCDLCRHRLLRRWRRSRGRRARPPAN